jgi:hypothetical protein
MVLPRLDGQPSPIIRGAPHVPAARAESAGPVA